MATQVEVQTHIGHNFKLLRNVNNLTQAQMADICMLTRSIYIQYELGNRMPTADILLMLSERFGVNIYSFFFADTRRFMEELYSPIDYDESTKQLVECFSGLSSFAKGMLLEKAQEMLDWDKNRKKVMPR